MSLTRKMTARRVVQMVEISPATPSGEVYLPYATQLLRAYVERFDDVSSAFVFAPVIFRRERFEAMVERVGRPDVLALSCYVWNFTASMNLAAAVKRRSPGTFVVLGGAQPRYGSAETLERYPEVDALVQGEGEAGFLNLLRALSHCAPLEPPDGVTWRDPRTGDIVVSALRLSTPDLSALPSPYGLGLLDAPLAELREQGRFSVGMTLESNRGCPFQCTFCDWGGLGSRLREFPLERVFADIDWASDNRIEVLSLTDSNFGMRKRDREIAARLAAAHTKTGHPKQVNLSISKNSTRAILDAVQPVAVTSMLNGVRLSFQSFSNEALHSVRRQNIKHSTYFELLEHARALGERVITEMILGLPGETLASFKEGLGSVIEFDPVGTITLHRCMLLPNSEMSSAADRRRYALRTAWMPVPDSSTPATAGDHRFVEMFEFVVGSATMSESEWGEAVAFAWVVQLLHSLKLGRPALRFLRHATGLTYVEIIDSMLKFLGRRPDTGLGAELAALRADVGRFLAGCRDPANLRSPLEVPWRADPHTAAIASRLGLVARHDRTAVELAMLTRAVAQSQGIAMLDDARDDLFDILRWTVFRPIPATEQTIALRTTLPDVVLAGQPTSEPVRARPGLFRLLPRGGVSEEAFRAAYADPSTQGLYDDAFRLVPVDCRHAAAT